MEWRGALCTQCYALCLHVVSGCGSHGMEGLIAGDYEAVFPVPFRQKWGISYAYQPPFTQQLGMYSQQGSQVIDIEGALSLLVERFSLIEIQLNSGNTIPDQFNITARPNFELALNAPYDALEAKYSGI